MRKESPGPLDKMKTKLIELGYDDTNDPVIEGRRKAWSGCRCIAESRGSGGTILLQPDRTGPRTTTTANKEA